MSGWSRRRKWFVGVTAVVVALAVAAYTAIDRERLSNRLKVLLQNLISERYGVAVSIDSLTVSLLGGSATIEGLRISDGPITVLEAARVDGVTRLGDILDGRYDFARIVIHEPVLRLFVEPDGRTNLGRILATPPKKPPGPRPGDVVVLRDLAIEDGRIEFTDAVAGEERPLSLTLLNVRGGATELQFAGEPVTRSYTDYRLDYELGQPQPAARVSIVAWGRNIPGPSVLDLHATVTGYDLRQIPQYVRPAQRTAIGGNFINLVADIQIRGGVIDPGAIVAEVAGTRTLLPMRVGGTTEDPVFEADSPLGSLMKIPLQRVGRFGSVTIGAGWSAVKTGAGAAKDIGSGVAGAGKSIGAGIVEGGGDVVSGDPLGALRVCAGGFKGAVKSVGGGIWDGVTGLFGGGKDAVDSFAGVDPATLDRQFGELHAKRRLELLRAALASVPAGVAPERRRRIEAEIDEQTPTEGKPAAADAAK